MSAADPLARAVTRADALRDLNALEREIHELEREREAVYATVAGRVADLTLRIRARVVEADALRVGLGMPLRGLP